MNRYKRKTLNFGNELNPVDLKAHKLGQSRKEVKFDLSMTIRGIDPEEFNESPESTTIPAPNKSLKDDKSTVSSRLEMLKKWREEKELRKKLESKNSKPPFIVGGSTVLPTSANEIKVGNRSSSKFSASSTSSKFSMPHTRSIPKQVDQKNHPLARTATQTHKSTQAPVQPSKTVSVGRKVTEDKKTGPVLTKSTSKDVKVPPLSKKTLSRPSVGASFGARNTVTVKATSNSSIGKVPIFSNKHSSAAAQSRHKAVPQFGPRVSTPANIPEGHKPLASFAPRDFEFKPPSTLKPHCTPDGKILFPPPTNAEEIPTETENSERLVMHHSDLEERGLPDLQEVECSLMSQFTQDELPLTEGMNFNSKSPKEHIPTLKNSHQHSSLSSESLNRESQSKESSHCNDRDLLNQRKKDHSYGVSPIQSKEGDSCSESDPLNQKEDEDGSCSDPVIHSKNIILSAVHQKSPTDTFSDDDFKELPCTPDERNSVSSTAPLIEESIKVNENNPDECIDFGHSNNQMSLSEETIPKEEDRKSASDGKLDCRSAKLSVHSGKSGTNHSVAQEILELGCIAELSEHLGDKPVMSNKSEEHKPSCVSTVLPSTPATKRWKNRKTVHDISFDSPAPCNSCALSPDTFTPRRSHRLAMRRSQLGLQSGKKSVFHFEHQGTLDTPKAELVKRFSTLQITSCYKKEPLKTNNNAGAAIADTHLISVTPQTRNCRPRRSTAITNNENELPKVGYSCTPRMDMSARRSTRQQQNASLLGTPQVFTAAQKLINEDLISFSPSV